MPRPNRSSERRAQLIPTVARTFAQLGYRRTTTAELASRCSVQETTLYRLWPDKKAMFIASIDYVFDLSTQMWEKLLAATEDGGSAAERLLEYEATHHGEFGLYRIVFAGLSETDEPEIRNSLRRMYRRFQAFVELRMAEHRGTADGRVAADVSAWAIIGMGITTALGRELRLFDADARQRLWGEVGRLLLEGKSP